jgi:hypothetical protein
MNGRNNMKTGKLKIILFGLVKIIIVFMIILANILFQKYYSSNSFFPSFIVNNRQLVEIVGGADGPTTIYIAGKYSWPTILKYSFSIIFITGLLILIVFDIIELLKNWRYTKRYKLKIILSIVIFIIFLVFFFIGFFIFEFLWLGISVLINITFSIIFFTKLILKLIKDKSGRII